LIEIQLLGGAKKAIGLEKIILNKEFDTVRNILEFLKGKSMIPHVLNKNNIMISINGIDSNVYDGQETVVKSGDLVVVVTIVHGG